MKRRDFLSAAAAATVATMPFLSNKSVAETSNKVNGMDPGALQDAFISTYAAEYQELGAVGVDAILERGREWNLAPVLSSGGVLTFPHVHIADCGPFTAAVVNACLDSGADTILVLSVLHPFAPGADDARIRVQTQKTQPEDEPLRGIFGPGQRENVIATWKKDHALYDFRLLLAAEAKRRGIKQPRLIERYPHLTGTRPETLIGIDDLQTIAKSAVLVTTADHCHHGIAYGDSRETACYYDEKGLAKIRTIVETGVGYLDKGDNLAFMKHCYAVSRSDWRDVGPVVHYLRPSLKTTVIDIVPSDFSKTIYKAPAPSWVAGCLVKLEPQA